ncbi:unnamed protein product, partial [Musa acuminata subsp. burmannicoides]
FPTRPGPTAGGSTSPSSSSVAAGSARVVESMKASSPTHAKATAALPSGDAAVDEQSAWVVSAGAASSALNKFEQIMSASKEADRDVHGLRWHTIAHRRRPRFRFHVRRGQTIGGQGTWRGTSHRDRQRAMPGQGSSSSFPHPTPTPPQTESISCRIFRLHAYPLLSLCGSGQTRSLSTGKRVPPMIDAVHKALLERTKSTPGARVENNKFCVSVHFRCVMKVGVRCFEQVRCVLKEYPKLRLTQGRKVLEIRPTIKWDKGKALEFLLESLGFANCTNVMPVYIGDDRTDEDAFKVGIVLRDRGQGFGILVSKFPKETNATYSLQEPSEASAHG